MNTGWRRTRRAALAAGAMLATTAAVLGLPASGAAWPGSSAGPATAVAPASRAALPPASRPAPLPPSRPAMAARPQLAVPADDPRVREALERVRELEPDTLETQVALCEIPAPPFQEEERAQEYRRRLQALGLADVRIDAEGNVIGEMRGTEEGPFVVLSAHLDTVFPEGTDVTVTRRDGLLVGPGIGDDCRGLAVVLTVARVLQETSLTPRGTLAFVGTVGEEGPGNLRGVRHLFAEELAGRVDHFVSVDGAGLSLTHAAVGSNRYEVTYLGPGGHSYGAFGMPNPIHALGRAIARVADFQVPSDPKTTFNVGLVEGGTSVNSIAFETTMTVDLRSEAPEALAELDARFRDAVQEALDEENRRWESDVALEVEVVSIGVRPAGQQPLDAPIVQAAMAAAEGLGFEASAGASSTDANLPMSLGIPSVTIDGGGDGSGAHSLDEVFDPTDSHLGTQWALLLALTLAGGG